MSNITNWMSDNPIIAKGILLSFFVLVVMIQIIRERTRNADKQDSSSLFKYLPADIVLAILSIVVFPTLINSLNDTRQELERISELNAIYDSANEMNHKGLYAEALAKWKELVEKDDDNSLYHGGYGTALFNMERYDEALREFDRAIEIKETATSYNYRGLIYERRDKNYEMALREYDMAHQMEPDVITYCLNKAMTLKNLGRYDEAVRELVEAIELLNSMNGNYNYDYYKAYYNYGIIEDLRQRYDEALLKFEKAQEYRPDNIELTKWINLEKARQDVADHPDDDSYINKLGNRFYYLEMYEEASAEYKKAIEINPNNSVYYSNMAGSEYDMGHYIDAIALVDKALEINPESKYAKHRKEVMMLENDYEDNPNDSELALKLGQAYIDFEQYSDARELFNYLHEEYPREQKYTNYIELLTLQSEVSSDSGNNNKREDLARKFWDMERYERAEDEFLKLLKDESVTGLKKAWYYNNLGCIYYEYGKDSGLKEDYEKSKKYFEMAHDIVPEDEDYIKNIDIANNRISEVY